MEIRTAIDSDRAPIAALHAASWRDAYRGIFPDDYLRDQAADDLQERWRTAEIRPQDLVLVAIDNGHLVAFIGVWCRPDPFIDNLHVQPAIRSKGIGRQLMIEAARRLQAAGHQTAYLYVLTQNAKALRFYERLGGQRRERSEGILFGAASPRYRIVWPDLARLANA